MYTALRRRKRILLKQKSRSFNNYTLKQTINRRGDRLYVANFDVDAEAPLNGPLSKPFDEPLATTVLERVLNRMLVNGWEKTAS